MFYRNPSGKLCIIAFFSGAVIMTLEIIGSRILAPFVGASVFVWTGLIGVVLASLSLGYWRGGIVADKDPSFRRLSAILFISAVAILASAVLRPVLFEVIRYWALDFRLKSVFATCILFATPSFYLGMVLPVVTKLSLEGSTTSGRLIGRVYAVSTVGSIAGTFATGFIFIAFFETTFLFVFLSLVMALLSWYAHCGKDVARRSALLGALGIVFIALPHSENATGAVIAARQSPYQYIRVIDAVPAHQGDTIRLLMTDDTPYRDRVHFSQAFMDIRDPDRLQKYLRYGQLLEHFRPTFRRVLAIGGGGYAYPRYLLKKFPDVMVDVVEIDPQITALAKQYFHLVDNPRLRIFHEDGRVFLNRAKETYDAVFIDAYTSSIPPFQLLTKEAAEEMSRLLSPDGVVLVYVISAAEGRQSLFLRTMVATYQSVFPQVYVFPTQDGDRSQVQNYMMIALKSRVRPSMQSGRPFFQHILDHRVILEGVDDVRVLTDEYAPVEFMYPLR